MSFDFQDKTVLITGAGSGIGRSTAQAFAKAGAKVVLAGRGEADGLETLDLIGGGRAGMFIKTDVTRLEEMMAAVKAAIDAYGRLDIAFNNAGVQPVTAAMADIDPADWERVLSVDVTGVYHSMKAEIPAMLAHRVGVIVNNASTSGIRGAPSQSGYSAGKHAVVGLTKSAALDYAEAGIRINAVLPGPVDTAVIAKVKTDDPENYNKWLNSIPLGRFGRPEEIADAVLFLSSDKATFITGQSLVIDGGLRVA